MGDALGKRKRRVSFEAASTEEFGIGVEHDQYLALLQKHFEQSYQPITKEHKPVDQHMPSDHDNSDDEWEGFSDEDGSTNGILPNVEVVDHSIQDENAENEEAAHVRKSFMGSRLPSDDALEALRRIRPVSKEEDPTSDASLALNDMALQRLLRESRLLSSRQTDEPDSTLQLSGKDRHRALDAQLQTLGAKTSLRVQKSMPRAQRIGIVRKAAEKESTRRREAKEAGIVLEKERRVPKESKRRDRGVGAPGVGKFRGGTLTLSASDIRSIQGPSMVRKKGKKGRR